mmetsp:Transcript_109395/g.244442  ORF Transcript_109395/g.244442 Transcript_109395/m.244442 type:complete len:384 (+) Transcript_109395:55-1206(+)
MRGGAAAYSNYAAGSRAPALPAPLAAMAGHVNPRLDANPAIYQGGHRAEASASHGRGRGLDSRERGGHRAGAELASLWDAEGFRKRLESAYARGEEGKREMRSLLREVAMSNYQLIQRFFERDVERTNLVTHQERRQRVQGQGRDPLFTISTMLTGDALELFAKRLKSSGRGGIVCGLNFANGEEVGGGYLHGARAQEEELCRQFPALFTSLGRAQKHGSAYPFGACTYRRGDRDSQRYADVLFTPRVVLRRAPQREGYRLLADREVVDNIAVVSAAAPNVKNGEVFDRELVMDAMRTIVIAPKLKEPRIETLVLGAWGCGAFGCSPELMSELFAKVLTEEKLGRLYREVHFAIPYFGGADQNARVFQATLTQCGVPLQVMGT